MRFFFHQICTRWYFFQLNFSILKNVVIFQTKLLNECLGCNLHELCFVQLLHRFIYRLLFRRMNASCVRKVRLSTLGLGALRRLMSCRRRRRRRISPVGVTFRYGSGSTLTRLRVWSLIFPIVSSFRSIKRYIT